MVAVKETDAENQGKAEAFWPTMVEFLFATRSWWVALCAEFDLTPAQGHALRTLDPARPVPMSTLAEALVCDASNVTGIIDKLEARGLAKRVPAEDRRVKVLVLTPEGEQVRATIRERLLDPPEWIAKLTRDAQRELRNLLRDALEGTRPDIAD